jgi:YYY domain-containing protein
MAGSLRILVAIFVVLLLSLFLRVLSLSHGLSFHPDERHIVMTVMGMSWADLNPHTFAYGSFPFYLMFFLSKALNWFSPQWIGYDEMFILGRSLSVFFGVLGIFLTFVLGRKLSGSSLVGLGAAALLALNPFHIQLSRFATVDVMLTTLNTATMLGCIWLLEGTKKWAAPFTGIMIGLSFATKISSLSLFLPALLALAVAPGQKIFFKRASFWSSLLILLVTAVLVAVVAQPYAILDVKTFLAHTTEQVNMVRGEWRPPYTIQYENTAPYFYHLGQMFNFTVGAPVFLSVLFGGIWALRGMFREIRWAWIVSLVWAAAVFFLVARYQVKFPRYLLPLYPLLMVLAAYGLARLYEVVSRRFGSSWAAIPASLVGVLALLSATAFVQIYQSDHVYHQASRWIYENVPRGSKILGVHWDDKLPLHLPGFSPQEYRYQYEGNAWDLPVYEPDSLAKMSGMATKLASADYLIFPTPRTYGSIPRVPEEFPKTTRMFQLLFTERLGYSMVASLKVYPSLWGRTINDDLADESFWVYDHPKVTVFRNEGRLGREEILRLLDQSESSSDLPSREEMMLANFGTALPVSSERHSEVAQQISHVIGWYLVIQLLSFLVLPFFVSIYTRAPDLGYAFSKIFGLTLFSFLAWLLATYASFPVNGSTLWVLLILLLIISLQFAWRNYSQISDGLSRRMSMVLYVEVLFGLGFVVMLILRALSPEIFWGEKPMDFSFLNYFIRLTDFPIDDPWFFRPGEAGGMNYYYLGFFNYALIHKLTGIPSGVGYNLALSTVGAMSLVSLWGVLLWVLKSPRVALAGALLVVAGSNFEVLYLWLAQGKALNFDLFWASSRGLTSPSISEYPIWSFLFADLHPHVMALPVAAALIGICVAPLVGAVRRGCEPVAAALLGLSLGIVTGLNSWDVMVIGLLVALAAFVWLGQGLSLFSRLERRLFLENWLFCLCIFSVVGGLTLSSIASVAQSSVRVGLGYVWDNEFNTVGQVFRHFGVWLAPAFCAGTALIWSRRHLASRWSLGVAGGLASIACILQFVVSAVHGVTNHPFGVLALCLVACVLGALLLATASGEGALLVAGSLLLLSGLVLEFTELFFVMDRMNTIFKFYYPLWVMFAISAMILVWRAGAKSAEGSENQLSTAPSTIARILVLAAALFSFGSCIVGSGINLWIMPRFHRIDGPRPTLDGTAYLEQVDGDEARMLHWLRDNIDGVVPVVEAWGDSYREFTRVTMHTGLPTILGWDYHVQQRGAPRGEIEKRKLEIRSFYENSDPERARSFLQKYEWPLVVVGNIERRAYGNLEPQAAALANVGYKVLAEFGPVAVWGPAR